MNNPISLLRVCIANAAIQKCFIIISALFLLSACGNTTKNMEQGKISFEQKNYTEAFEELRPAAARGNKDAQYAIGYMYFYGKGVDKDKRAAKQWINKAAKQGQPQAVKAMERMAKKPAATP